MFVAFIFVCIIGCTQGLRNNTFNEYATFKTSSIIGDHKLLNNDGHTIDSVDSVYLGGFPLGIGAKSDFLIVQDFIQVTTSEGSFSPALQSGVQKGDMIVLINGKRVDNVRDFIKQIENSDMIVLTVKRGKRLIDYEINPVYDLTQKSKKIGISLKNDLIGIGTMTFMTENGRYGALGHGIYDEFGLFDVYQKGNIYPCQITGYTVADRNQPGELRGSVSFEKPIGTIEKNVFCGLFGDYLSVEKKYEKVLVAKRGEVTTGKAQIFTTIEGNTPQLYDIEIIRAFQQDQPADKSMVIRVTDRTLRRTTGGILQGMSGSPILQNGKLIGAVTHVFTADSTKGYGVYIDWMLQEALGT